MLKLIKEKSKNIGALSNFLKKPINNKYVNFINSNIPSSAKDLKISEKLYYLLNDIKEIELCSCGNKKSFIGFKNGYRKTCGNKKCYVKKRKETCIEKMGVDNPKKSKKVIEREKENIKKKWGGSHYMNNSEIKAKFKKAMLNNWGHEWAQQSNEIKKKSLSTWNSNENKINIIKQRSSKIKNKSIDEKKKTSNKRKNSILKRFGSYDSYNKYKLRKIKEKSILNYGVDHHLKSKEVIDKRVKTYKENVIIKIKNKLPDSIEYIDKKQNKSNTDSIIKLRCIECDSTFEVNRQLLESRILSNVNICLCCNPIKSGKSNREIELYEFIKDNYDGDIVLNSKKIISNELDIYLPSINLAFEFNGLYWHSDLYKDKNYHLRKSNECLEKGINLMHIWEDDWDYKKDIVKSMILNKIKKSNRIFARKCTISEISDNKIIRKFLNDNHIQGFVGSKVKIGLFYKGELISIMTFGKLRKSLGQKHIDGNYELLRFCNKIGTSVVGGASRLFKYFIKKYKPNKVISYSDNSRGFGNLYNKLNFILKSETEPNYYWIIDGIKKHRFGFRKQVLIKKGFDPNKTETEIMKSNGHYRIFDCGSKKWLYEPN